MHPLGYNENDQYAYIAQLINLGLEVSKDPVVNYQRLMEYRYGNENTENNNK